MGGQGKDFNRTLEATNALKNILLLGECDYLVGSDRSYFFQAAWMLQFASGARLSRGVCVSVCDCVFVVEIAYVVGGFVVAL